jgi:hypothetical protein
MSYCTANVVVTPTLDYLEMPLLIIIDVFMLFHKYGVLPVANYWYFIIIFSRNY